jgi:NAD(P)H-dependent flavin oxidoreductase YrpB (nitropropane dioxygenase family)
MLERPDWAVSLWALQQYDLPKAKGGMGMLKTALCAQLGIEYPVLSAGIGPAATPELAAAVSNAGGCGVIGGGGHSGDFVRAQVRRARELTDRPFGINIILAGEDDPEPIEAAIAEHVPVLVFFWGDPAPYLSDAHRQGVKVLLQVGSVEEAASAAAAGTDAIIAQGSEAGGHVRGTTALSVIVPAVVDVVGKVPVIASGGIADGRGLVAALALGAQGVSLGTRFLASEEVSVPQRYKERVVTSTADDTVYLHDLFDVGWPGAPHRVIRNTVVLEWEAAGRPPSGQRPGEGTIVGTRTILGQTRELAKYAAAITTRDFEGDLESVPLWAGQSCSLVRDIKPAGQIVHDIVREATTVIEQLSRLTGVPA